MTKKSAIYHFTNGSTKRPKIYKDQLNRLIKFAAKQGLTVTEIFCDMSLKRSERSEFDRFLSNSDQFDALVTKDFYHISKNTMKCMSVMKELQNKGVSIYTTENGSFSWMEPPFNEPLRVVTYCCHFGTKNEMEKIIPVQNDILKLFATKKTNWTVIDQYFDGSFRQKNGEQVQLMELLKNKEKYDLLLVHNLNNINWHTAKFCKIREQLQLDIYSLQEGFLKYDKLLV